MAARVTTELEWYVVVNVATLEQWEQSFSTEEEATACAAKLIELGVEYLMGRIERQLEDDPESGIAAGSEWTATRARWMGRDPRDEGTLWERLADASLNQDVLIDSQWVRMCAQRNVQGTRRPGLDGDARGTLLSKDFPQGLAMRFSSNPRRSK